MQTREMALIMRDALLLPQEGLSPRGRAGPIAHGRGCVKRQIQFGVCGE